MNISHELDTILRRYLKHLGPDKPLDPDAELTKLGLDSMSSINLMLDLETTFNVLIPDEMLTPQVFGTGRSLQCAMNELTVRAC